MQKIKLNTKDLKNEIPNLSAGDEVLLSGVVYTARDAAHARLLELMEKGVICAIKELAQVGAVLLKIKNTINEAKECQKNN